MVRLRVKVGPKGQIVIPKTLREAYHIVEGGYAILEPREDGLQIHGAPPPEKVLRWIRERRIRLGSNRARMYSYTLEPRY